MNEAQPKMNTEHDLTETALLQYIVMPSVTAELRLFLFFGSVINILIL